SAVSGDDTFDWAAGAGPADTPLNCAVFFLTNPSIKSAPAYPIPSKGSKTCFVSSLDGSTSGRLSMPRAPAMKPMSKLKNRVDALKSVEKSFFSWIAIINLFQANDDANPLTNRAQQTAQ